MSVADGLAFAASPVFVALALLPGLLGSEQASICSSAQASPMSGMFTMYLVMGALHAAPWLRLLSGRQAKRR
jgi:hypothetical protein